jgi:hypothetical protein
MDDHRRKLIVPWCRALRSWTVRMWIRRIVGAVLVPLGGVRIAQGTGAMHGSLMTGRRGYAVLGAVTIAAGMAPLALLVPPPRGRRSLQHSSTPRA